MLPPQARLFLQVKTMRKVLRAVGVLVAVVMVIVLAGFALPVEHEVSRSVHVDPPPDQVFAVVTDVENYPRWRSGVSSVEVLAREPLRWREHGDETIAFERVDVDPPRRLVTRIVDEGLPFGGRWTFTLAPEGTGTRLTITENGEVYNPLFRFMSRFVFGHAATIEQFLDDLEARLGAPAQTSRLLSLRHAPVAQLDRASAF